MANRFRLRPPSIEPVPSTSSDADDAGVEEASEVSLEARTTAIETFGDLASSFLTPYRYDKQFLDKHYGEGTLKIGNCTVSVDGTNNIITNRMKRFKGTPESKESECVSDHGERSREI